MSRQKFAGSNHLNQCASGSRRVMIVGGLEAVFGTAGKTIPLSVIRGNLIRRLTLPAARAIAAAADGGAIWS